MKALNLHDELNGLGIRFEPIGFVKAPAYPYGIYVDDATVRQPDENIGRRVITHRISIEVYHSDLKLLEAASLSVDGWLNQHVLNYTKQPRYVIDEDHYAMTYHLQSSTKQRNEAS